MYSEVIMNIGIKALKRGDNDTAISLFEFAEKQTNNEYNKARARDLQASAQRLDGAPVNASAAIRRMLNELASGAGTKQNLFLMMRKSRQDRFKDLVSSVRLVRKLARENSDRATRLISTAVASRSRLHP